MQALIFQNKVIQIEENPFPVAKEFKWIEIGRNVVMVGYGHDGENFIAPPEPPKPTNEELRYLNYPSVMNLLLMLHSDMKSNAILSSPTFVKAIDEVHQKYPVGAS